MMGGLAGWRAGGLIAAQPKSCSDEIDERRCSLPLGSWYWPWLASRPVARSRALKNPQPVTELPVRLTTRLSPCELLPHRLVCPQTSVSRGSLGKGQVQRRERHRLPWRCRRFSHRCTGCHLLFQGSLPHLLLFGFWGCRC